MAPWHMCYKNAMAFAMAPWHLFYNNAMAFAMVPWHLCYKYAMACCNIVATMLQHPPLHAPPSRVRQDNLHESPISHIRCIYLKFVSII